MTPERASSLVGKYGTRVVVVFLSMTEVDTLGRSAFFRIASLFRAMPMGCLMVLVADSMAAVERTFAGATHTLPSATTLDVMLDAEAGKVSRRKQAHAVARKRAVDKTAMHGAMAAAAHAHDEEEKRRAGGRATAQPEPGAKRTRV